MKNYDFPGMFRARLDRVIDGDTIQVVVDVGFNIMRTERVRFSRIDAYELNDPNPENVKKAKDGRAFVAMALGEAMVGWPIGLHTSKADSFGRWLAEIYYHDMHDIERNLNDELLEAGLAVPYARK